MRKGKSCPRHLEWIWLSQLNVNTISRWSEAHGVTSFSCWTETILQISISNEVTFRPWLTQKQGHCVIKNTKHSLSGLLGNTLVCPPSREDLLGCPVIELPPFSDNPEEALASLNPWVWVQPKWSSYSLPASFRHPLTEMLQVSPCVCSPHSNL